MLNSPLLNAVLGLLLTYALFGLLMSTLQETIATVFNLRARTLLNGIKQLLNDPQFNDLAQKVYNHVLVNPLGNGQAGSKPKPLPSYIDADNFALALLESVQAFSDGKTITDLSQLTATIPDAQIRSYLQGVLTRANGDINQAKAEISDWFNAAMDRLSGNYKRNSQYIGVGLALVIACGMGINTIALFNTYWKTPTAQQLLSNPAIASAVAANTPGSTSANTSDNTSGKNPASATPAAPANSAMLDIAGQSQTIATQLQLLDTLPIGPEASASQPLWLRSLGYVLTALSVLFGAPFWFGLLQNFVNIRGTGNKPAPAN